MKTAVRTQRCFGGAHAGVYFSHMGRDGDLIYLPFFVPGRPLRYTGYLDDEGRLEVVTDRAEYVARPAGLYFIRYTSDARR